MKRKTKILIFSVIALIVIAITATCFFTGRVKYNVHTHSGTRVISVVDGVATPQESTFSFTLKKDGTYLIDTAIKANEPGIIIGYLLSDEDGNTLLVFSAESCTIDCSPRKLAAGDYTLTLHYFTNQADADKFFEKYEGSNTDTPSKDETTDWNYDFIKNGEREITYSLVIEKSYNLLHLSFVFGVLIGLIFVVILLTVTKKGDSLRCKYDERQELAKGRGFKYAFFTMLICNFIVFLLNLIEMLPFADISIWIAIICMASISVYVCYCIWNDAYFALNENCKSLIIIFSIGGIANLGLGILAFIRNVAIQNGKITFQSLNLFCGIMFLVIFATMFLKKICTDGKDE